MSENESVLKEDNVKKIAFRWAIFLGVVFVIVLASYFYVKSVAAKRIASVVKSEAPVFDADVLYKDPDARRQFLAARVAGANFFVYTVKKRDNLWTIAKKYHYSVHSIIGCNPQFTTYDIFVGQKILIPSIGGTLHPIQKNDTWEEIAKKYDIDEANLRKTNFGITKLNEGEYLFVAGKRPAIDLMNKEMQDRYALRSLFISPLGGRFTSGFGKRRHPVTGRISVHGGLDIAAKEGTKVGAAADGVVIVASYDAGYYGVAVFIDHQNGYITHYGHLSKINVRVGQRVKAGQIIARSGSTGRVTGPHLHFTVKKGNTAMNPLRFLW